MISLPREAPFRRQIARCFTFDSLMGFAWSVVRAVLVIGICFVIVYPVFIKVTSSLMTLEDIVDSSARWLPIKPSFAGFRLAYELMNYPRSLLNSLWLAILVGVLQLASCSLVGYGLARFKFRGNGIIFGLAVFTLMVPQQMISIPLYLNFRFFNFFGMSDRPINLLNTFWPFALTSGTAVGFRNGLLIFIMRQFFKGMPKDLEEAAYVDGAGPFKAFFTVMLPSAIPAMVIVFLFSFVWQWNDYLLTLTFLRNSETLPIALQMLPERYFALEDSNGVTQYSTILNNAGSLMLMAPLILLYAVAQRFFLESVARTGIVG
jgi:multiple sugar transport system permease protein